MVNIIRDKWGYIQNYTTIKSRAIFVEGIEAGILRIKMCFTDNVLVCAMGDCLSVAISGLFLDMVLEKTAIKPVLLAKYVDDILAITDKDEVDPILTELNAIHHHLKFTCKQDQH